jgi:hypothetical protein
MRTLITAQTLPTRQKTKTNKKGFGTEQGRRTFESKGK